HPSLRNRCDRQQALPFTLVMRVGSLTLGGDNGSICPMEYASGRVSQRFRPQLIALFFALAKPFGSAARRPTRSPVLPQPPSHTEPAAYERPRPEAIPAPVLGVFHRADHDFVRVFHADVPVRC